MKRLRIRKSLLAFSVPPHTRKRPKGAIRCGHTFSVGLVIYISGSYPIEGFHFEVLVLDRGKAGLTVLEHTGAET